MPFNSKNNKITIKGFLSSDITEDEKNNYAITFTVKVARPADSGGRVFFDEFTVYCSDRQNVSNCKANLTKGMSVKISGELRVWNDGTYKICVSSVQPIW